MDSKHSLPELIEILKYANYITIHNRDEIAALIQRQDQEITRLEGQHVFDKGIVRVQAAKIERQEKIIDRAIGQLRKSGCPIFIAKKCLDQQEPLASECPPDRCWRRWLEEEAGK